MALELLNPPAADEVQQARRPLPPLQESFVLFLNTTNRPVNLYWIDHNGRQTFHYTLRSGGTVKINTFCSHPWIFRDRNSGERFQVAHQDTFWPQAYLMRDPRNSNQWIPCRKQIAIHLPVRTLRKICLWSVIAAIQPSNVVESIDAICLPQTLKSDMKILLHAIENHRRTLR